jgi:hypothetical protein
VSVRSLFGCALFLGAVALGSWLDPGDARAAGFRGVLEADLHVHPHPGDGALSIPQLQREAARRGLDVIAVTAHNNRVALDLDSGGSDRGAVVIVPGQEITAPLYHLVALGTNQLIDWRLPLREAIAAVHAQGGAAVAAHPVESSWLDPDADALRLLDGTEVAHPGLRPLPAGRDEYLEFYRRVLDVNPDVAPIGSSDFHTSAALGYCRTYILTDDRSASSVVEAVRRGATVAQRPNGRLHGSEANRAKVEAYLAERVPIPQPGRWDLVAVLGALSGLALLSWPPRRGRPQ